MPSCNTYHLTWVSLTLDMGYLFTAAPRKHSHCSLPWTRVSPQGHPSRLWTWSSFSRPSCAVQPPLLGHGVAPVGHRPWPRTWLLWAAPALSQPGALGRLPWPWVRGSSSQAWSEVESLSLVWLFVTPWTIAYQASPMGFSRQEYWSGLPFLSPEDLPHPGIEPVSPTLYTDALLSEPPEVYINPFPLNLPSISFPTPPL